MSKASVAKTTPSPVAASLPSEPPRSLNGKKDPKKKKNQFRIVLNLNWPHFYISLLLTIGFPVTTAGECP